MSDLYIWTRSTGIFAYLRLDGKWYRGTLDPMNNPRRNSWIRCRPPVGNYDTRFLFKVDEDSDLAHLIVESAKEEIYSEQTS